MDRTYTTQYYTMGPVRHIHHIMTQINLDAMNTMGRCEIRPVCIQFMGSSHVYIKKS